MVDGLGLGGAYGATLGRIKEQGKEESRLGMAALMWISHSERPLKVQELCHALGVEIGAADLDGDNAPSIGTLLACCQGLVAVDKETSTVRLIHFTLQQYLQAHPELFNGAHATIAETCLSYLDTHQVRALSTNPSPDLEDTPFLEYSSLYWGMHAKRDLSARAEQLALKLFEDNNNHISINLLLDAEKPWLLFLGHDKYPGFSSLHCASFFGIVKMVDELIKAEDCDVNKADCIGITPLVWATWNGHEEVVKLLLGRGDVKPNRRCVGDRTPLLCAAWRGHEGVVKMLLDLEDIHPDEPEFLGRTPLWCAAEYGREGVVKILLGRDDVNPDKPDNAGQTPLWSAAFNGHGGVVKILLRKDEVNAGKPDNAGQTPLWCAAWYGYEDIVKILLRRGDFNPDQSDNSGQTPLWCAARNGHEGVVKILLGLKNVNPNKPNKHGQTPLHCAAFWGHEGVVRILLGRDDVNPGGPDGGGQTPRSLAASSGHAGVVALLSPPASVPIRPGRPKCRAAVFGQDGGPYRVRHSSSEQGVDGRGLQGTAGDGRRRWGTGGDGRKRMRTAWDGGGLRETAGDRRGPPGTARVMSHDVKRIRLEVHDFGLASAGGPSAGTMVPYSPSGRHLPGRSPS